VTIQYNRQSGFKERGVRGIQNVQRCRFSGLHRKECYLIKIHLPEGLS
jgi:hypothetical protein